MRPAFACIACLLIHTALSPTAAAQDQPVAPSARPPAPASPRPRVEAAPVAPETPEPPASEGETETEPRAKALPTEEPAAEQPARVQPAEAQPAEAPGRPEQALPDSPPEREKEETAPSPGKRAAAQPATCTPRQIRAALERGREALVVVEAPMGYGLGFAFHSRDHIATSMSLVEAGRGIEVVVDGSRRDAVVVAYDRARDLAILKLDRPLAKTPLGIASRALRVGDPLLALGQAGYEDVAVVIQPGTVTAVSEGGLRSDALEHPHLSWGGPLLDCHGEVVGVATSMWESEAADVERLRRVEEEIAEDAVYDGGWSALHPSFGLLIQVDHAPKQGFESPDAWVGLSLGTALIGADQWFFPLRFNAAVLAGPQLEDPLIERTGVRLQGETGIGYRAMLTGGLAPLYLVPRLGVSFGYEEIRSVATRLQPDSNCADCYLSTVTDEQVDSLFRVMPTAGLGLQLGPGELSYQLQLDPEYLERSIHQITVGFQF